MITIQQTLSFTLILYIPRGCATKLHFFIYFYYINCSVLQGFRVLLESARQSSEIFGNFRKFSENVRERSSGLRDNLKNLRKSSEGGRKSSENHQKRRHQYVYIIKRILHVSSKI